MWAGNLSDDIRELFLDAQAPLINAASVAGIRMRQRDMKRASARSLAYYYRNHATIRAQLNAARRTPRHVPNAKLTRLCPVPKSYERLKDNIPEKSAHERQRRYQAASGR